MTGYGLPYPYMKIFDMGFCQIGFELDTNKRLKNAHEQRLSYI